jgi:hypothetical protein
MSVRSARNTNLPVRTLKLAQMDGNKGWRGNRRGKSSKMEETRREKKFKKE